MSTNLILYKKAELLLHESYAIIKNFPQAEKYGLSQEIKQSFYRMLRGIVMANNLQHKRRMLQDEIDAEIKLLVVLSNIAVQQKYISKSRHHSSTQKLIELGKILGGWMKK